MAYWPDTGTGVDTQPARKPVQSFIRKYFTEGGIGQAPTVPGGDWFNQMTNEVLNVLEAAGIEPSKTDDDQLLNAIKAICSNGVTIEGALEIAPSWDDVPAYKDGGLNGVMNDQALALMARSEILLSNLLEVLSRSYAKSGYILRQKPECFKNGGVLTSEFDVLLDTHTGKAWSWPGPYPHDVEPNTDPTLGGFIDRSRELSVLEFDIVEPDYP